MLIIYRVPGMAAPGAGQQGGQDGGVGDPIPSSIYIWIFHFFGWMKIYHQYCRHKALKYLCSSVLCSAVQCSAVQCRAVQCSALSTVERTV